MNGTINWLLGLDALRPGMEGVEFGFERPLPAWAWALVTLAAVFVAWRAYRRLEGAIAARFALGSFRAALLVLVAVLIAGPRLIKPNETEERDWLIVLADRSASMTVRDAARPTSAERIAREAQLAATLAESREIWKRLADDRVVLWLGFDSGAFELPASAEGPLPDLGEPVGRRTAIGRALEQAARPRRATGFGRCRSLRWPKRRRRARGVTRASRPSVCRLCRAAGRDAPLPGLAVREVDAPRPPSCATVPVKVDLEQLGAPMPPVRGGRRTHRHRHRHSARQQGGRLARWAGCRRHGRAPRVVLTTRPLAPGAGKWSCASAPAPARPRPHRRQQLRRLRDRTCRPPGARARDRWLPALGVSLHQEPPGARAVDLRRGHASRPGPALSAGGLDHPRHPAAKSRGMVAVRSRPHRRRLARRVHARATSDAA